MYNEQITKKQLEFLANTYLKAMVTNAATRAEWDFNTAAGDTCKEKYQSLFVRMSDLTNVIARKCGGGHFWLLTTGAVAGIFEIADASFDPTPLETAGWVAQSGDEEMVDPRHLSIGWPVIQCRGFINNKWKLFANESWCDHERILIGCNFKPVLGSEDYERFGVIDLINFTI